MNQKTLESDNDLNPKWERSFQGDPAQPSGSLFKWET